MTSLFRGPCSGLLTAGGYLDPLTSLRPCPQKCTSQPLSARVLLPGKHKDHPFGAGPRSDGPAPIQLMGSSPILVQPRDGHTGCPPSCHLSLITFSLLKHTLRADLQACLTSGRGISYHSPLLAGTQNLYKWDVSGWRWVWDPFFSQESRKGISFLPILENYSQILVFCSRRLRGVGMEWEKSLYDAPKTVLLVCVSWLSEIWGIQHLATLC